MATDPEPVILFFPRAPAGRRLALHLRGLLAPRVLAILAALAGTPPLVGELMLPGGELAPMMLAVGLGSAALVVLAGGLTALVQGVPDTTLRFDAERIVEQRDGRDTLHGWDWVVRHEVSAARIEIAVRPPPMQSFRLAKPAPVRFLVPRDRVDEETLARLDALLSMHAR